MSGDDVPPVRDPLAEQRAAVVEAAKAFRSDGTHANEELLCSAVDALLAAERPQEPKLRECKCGATPTMTQGSEPPDQMAQVVCENCGRRGPNCWTVATAAAAWNVRPERGDAAAVIGELDAAVHSWVHAVGVLIAVQCASPVEGREDAAHRTVFAAKRRYTAAVAAAEALGGGE